MHAGSAAHHRGDSLGPVHSEITKHNKWTHARLHSERVSEIDGDGRHGRKDRQRDRTKNLYGRDYRSGEGTKEMEMGGMGGCMQAMQHTTNAMASVRCTSMD